MAFDKKEWYHWNKDKTKLKCRNCSEYKIPEDFDVDNTKPYRGNRDTRCKHCKAVSAKNRRTQRNRTDALDRIFIERLCGARTRAKIKNLYFDLTIEDLENIYRDQNGCCALSGIPMTYAIGKGRVPTNISIDQIDPGKGYTRSNIQLVCMAVNQMKSDLCITELLVFCKGIINTLA